MIFDSLSSVFYKRGPPLLSTFSQVVDSMESPFTASGNIDYCTHFYQEVVECPWKRCWIIAILQYIHRHVSDLESPVQPMYSEEALLHGRHIHDSIKTAMRQFSLETIHQAWRRLLLDYHVEIPCWQPNDIEFVVQVTEQILEEIVSFRRQFSSFTYELLGLTHEDVDHIFGWARDTLREREWVGIDIPDSPDR